MVQALSLITLIGTLLESACSILRVQVETTKLRVGIDDQVNSR